MRTAVIAVIAALAFAKEPVTAQTPAPLTVIVEGVARSVPATTLRSLPRDSASLTFHDQPEMTYQGVSLASILRSVGVRTDSLRGTALTTRLVIEAADGYRVILTLADLDPSLGGRNVLLADRLEGKPLPPNEGPWRLVVVGDQHPSRSARQVLRIRVLSEPR